MELTFAPSLHTSLLVIASILLIYALLLKDRYAHLLALGLVVFEMVRYLLIFPANRLHMSLDLVIVGFIGTSCLISRYRVIKSILGFTGFILLLGHHHTEFLRSNTNTVPVDTNMELMVQFENQANLRSWISNYGLEYDLTFPLFTPQDKSHYIDEFVGINLPDNDDIHKAIRKLSQYPEVLSVEMNELVQLEQLPDANLDKLVNDSQLNKQWISDSYKLEDYHRLVNRRSKITGYTDASPSTVIAILDTGVDGNHEDLIDNYLSTASRYDADKRGHGTHCAGIAAAVTGNNLGIASLLPPNSPVKVTGIKVLSDRGVGSQKMIIDGIIKASDLGYGVISMSLGGLTNDKREQAYRRAVEYATAKGAIVIAAAGNSGRDARFHSPANTPGIITVTAVGPDKKLASFANQVSSLKMGVAAPGVSIFSTIPGDEYKAFNGTSMATSFVGGLIGLMKHYDSDLDAKQAYKFILENADEVDGVPIVNPLQTLEAFFATLDSVSEE